MADSAGAVLRAVLDLGPAPRTAVARHAGLSPATVTSASRSLLAAGLLTELPGVGGAVGRPTNPLALAADSNVVLAVHVAATVTSVAVVDLAGIVRRTDRIPHRGAGPGTVLDAAADRVLKWRSEIGERVLGLGIATGGWVDRDSGTVVEHPALGWRDVPVRDRLAARTGLPTGLDSHARGLVHAERLFGQVGRADCAVVLFVGNVIDAALAVHGSVHYGPRSGAGSLGRMLGGAPRPLGDYTERALLDRSPHPDFAALVAAAAAGDTPARALLLERARALGQLLAVLIDLIDPDTVVVVDRALDAVPGVYEAYLAAVREFSAVCDRPEKVVIATSFDGRVLELSAGAVALHEIFAAPLAHSNPRYFKSNEN
ncbi:ROK family protein [Nocardia sp. alder85J]|uniref:ROK family protein n=1 Tax=Nocardia sp. alder85J TaxID=2862949 RepID=UPI001CD7AEE2|nr:ROK family protein [Nocardia sp. alder85J]MCX4098519.1 ROK family protein [Nocardia sp. alder85J]